MADADAELTAKEPLSALIAQMILDGEFGPNDRLKLSDLAQRFSVGHMPVREALWKLEGSGLVENIPNRGAVVRRIDETYIRNVYEVRMAIEAALLESAVRQATSADVRRIDRARIAFEEAAAGRGAKAAKAMSDGDAEFHGTIHSIAGNDFAKSLLAGSLQLMRSLRLRVGFKKERVREIIVEHQQIYQAIERGDVTAAIHYSRLHSKGALNGSLEAFRSIEAKQA